MPLPAWALALPNRGQLYERLVLDNLPRGVRALARGARDAPFDLLVREPSGEVLAWEVKGNELDARGGFVERRRFSASPRQVRWVEENAPRVRLCLLWLDPLRDRFGYRVVRAEEARWKSPASPKWVLPTATPIALRRDLARYGADAEGRRLEARWLRLPEAHALEAPLPVRAARTASVAWATSRPRPGAVEKSGGRGLVEGARTAASGGASRVRRPVDASRRL